VREELLEALQQIVASGQPGALATVVRVTGSTPQRPGARMLMRADGSLLGTVGGGAIEQVVVGALHTALAGGDPYLLVRELGYDLGMCCGGRMEVFIEPLEAKPRLWLCGAGHVSEAVAGLARSVGFAVIVVDERDEQNNEQRFAGCTRELVDPPALLRRSTLGARDWLLIATHDHHLDEQVLEVALAQKPRYVGLVGSRRKVFRLLQRIAARRGESGLSLDNVYAPVGLALGAVGPEEIAVSVVAELVALRRGQAAAHMTAVRDERWLRGVRGSVNGDVQEDAHAHAHLDVDEDVHDQAPEGERERVKA
jgi:xanthine dehydrogenase accessory factor